MKRLTVIYDANCPFCQRCRAWLKRQPAFVPLEFVPVQAGEVDRRFPGIRELHPERDLVVISDAGEVWQGGSAWVMCLWALREYREASLRLAHPALLPLARRTFDAVSNHRGQLSRWLFRAATPGQLRQELDALPAVACPDEVCGWPQ